MRARLPSSRGALRIRFSWLDLICAVASPILALFIRDAYILNTADGLTVVALYCGVWIVFSLIFFQVFHLYDGLADHFSVHDAFDVVKAVACTELFTCLVFFTVSRLDGIPRTMPIVHALILATSLISVRAIVQALSNGAKSTKVRQDVALENIIIIGATQLSSLYIKLIEASSPGLRRVLAILDDQPRLIGRSMAGIRILASPQQLECVVDEFIVHGIHTDRVIIGNDTDAIPDEALKEIRQVCANNDIKLDFVGQLIGLPELHPTKPDTIANPTSIVVPEFVLSRYFTFRRLADPFAALVLIILLLPSMVIAALLVLMDIGSPVMFWQQRIGRNGRAFLVYKFRTLKAPYDWRGRPISDRNELSFIGRILRQTRCDELPQLFNVLVGDMALIGPRPLLPKDQPTNPAMRLIARPGITGWAQVNGGKFLTPEEKDRYDEFYIRNASVWFDLRILYLTLKVLFRIGYRSDHKVAAADRVGFGKKEAAASTIRPRAVHTAHASVSIESPSLDPADVSSVILNVSGRAVQKPNQIV